MKEILLTLLLLADPTRVRGSVWRSAMEDVLLLLLAASGWRSCCVDRLSVELSDVNSRSSGSSSEVNPASVKMSWHGLDDVRW